MKVSTLSFSKSSGVKRRGSTLGQGLAKALAASLLLWAVGEGAAMADAPDAGYVPKRERPLPPPGPWVAYDCCGNAVYHRKHRGYRRPRLTQTWSAAEPAPRYAARIYRDGELYSPYRTHRPIVIRRSAWGGGYVADGAYREHRRADDDAPALNFPDDRRCQHWSNRCSEEWGEGGADYYGCLRYHSCD